MLTVLTFLGVLAALFFAAALATREGEQLRPAPPDAADLNLPDGPLRAEDVAGVRFGLAPRGYRMSEVDAVLERLSGELAARDAELERLRAGTTQPVTGSEPVTGSGPVTESRPAAAPAASPGREGSTLPL